MKIYVPKHQFYNKMSVLLSEYFSIQEKYNLTLFVVNSKNNLDKELIIDDNKKSPFDDADIDLKINCINNINSIIFQFIFKFKNSSSEFEYLKEIIDFGIVPKDLSLPINFKLVRLGNYYSQKSYNQLMFFIKNYDIFVELLSLHPSIYVDSLVQLDRLSYYFSNNIDKLKNMKQLITKTKKNKFLDALSEINRPLIIQKHPLRLEVDKYNSFIRLSIGNFNYFKENKLNLFIYRYLKHSGLDLFLNILYNLKYENYFISKIHKFIISDI